MEYDELLNDAYNENIEIIEIPFNTNIKGLYCDKVIGLNSRIDTIREKKCILAEELGHYHTSYGNILNDSLTSIKVESIARRWAYNSLISLNDFISAFNDGINNKNDLACYLDVTVPFLEDTISFYRNKYGVKKVINNYIVFFEPFLSIIKRF